MVNNLTSSSIMDQTFGLAKALLDRMTKTNRAWHTRDTEVSPSVTSNLITNKKRRKEEERDETLANMMTQMECWLRT